MSPNICYPFVLNPTGGSFESTKLLIEHLDTDKFNPTMVFGVEGSAASSARNAEVKTDIVPIPQHILDTMRDETGLFTEATIGFRLLPYLLNLRGHLLNEDVDLVHVNDGLTAILWGIAGRLAGVPIVWHVRSERSNLWDSLRLRLVDQLIFVAESNKRRFDHESLDKVDASVVYNAVDTSTFTSGSSTIIHDELEIQSDIPLVGFVGNLVPRKRPMLFVNAAIDAISKGCSAHFVLVGEDQAEFNSEIERAITGANFENRFHVLGYRNDIPQIMQALDLLVLTSTEHGEAFPRVPLEAMASGTPVVTTETAGVSESVVDGETGRVVDAEIDPDELAKEVMKVISDNKRLQKWGKYGVERVHSKFSADQYVKRVQTVYETIVE